MNHTRSETPRLFIQYYNTTGPDVARSPPRCVSPTRRYDATSPSRLLHHAHRRSPNSGPPTSFPKDEHESGAVIMPLNEFGKVPETHRNEDSYDLCGGHDPQKRQQVTQSWVEIKKKNQNLKIILALFMFSLGFWGHKVKESLSLFIIYILDFIIEHHASSAHINSSLRLHVFGLYFIVV